MNLNPTDFQVPGFLTWGAVCKLKHTQMWSHIISCIPFPAAYCGIWEPAFWKTFPFSSETHRRGPHSSLTGLISLQSPCYAAICLFAYSVKSFLNKCLTLSNLSQCLSVGFLMHSVITTSVLQNSWSSGVWQTLSMCWTVSGRTKSVLEVVKLIWNNYEQTNILYLS